MFAPRSGRFLVAGLAVLILWAAAIAAGPLRHWLWVGGFAIALAFWAFLAWFFRDPERVIGPEIVSPADGRVLLVGAEGDRWQVAVFMNVTDVHVNRFPLDASVLEVVPDGQGYRPAYSPLGAHNVRLHYRLISSLGPVEVVAITGLVARRLVPFVRPGDQRKKGDRIGMIVLGSRVDVFLPMAKIVPLVVPGQRVVAGVTPIARAKA